MYDRDQPSPQHPFLGMITKGTIFYHAFLSLWISSNITWSSSYRASTAILADLYKVFKKIEWFILGIHIISSLLSIGWDWNFTLTVHSWPVWFDILVLNMYFLFEVLKLNIRKHSQFWGIWGWCYSCWWEVQSLNVMID